MKPERAVVILISFGLAVMLGWLTQRERHPQIPNERKVAMELLSKSQTGVGYFQIPPTAIPDAEGVLWADPSVIGGQIDRVAEERKLDAGQRRKLETLVRDLVEEHPSRVVGGARINLARLNVALDALK